MERFFCYGKKDFCAGEDSDCNECNFENDAGGVEEELLLEIFHGVFGDDYDMNRLRELVEADRDGRCVMLPCKVGDMVYSAFPLCGVNNHEIRKLEINSDGAFACSALMIPLSDFNKTVFLTREAAEAALEGAQDE